MSLASLLVSQVREQEDAFEKLKIVKMNDLRVYTNSSGTDTLGKQTEFYSRRADGPFYRWLYEEEMRQWQVSRVHLSRSHLKVLCAASWKIVPPELKAKIDEHYLG